MKKNAKIVDIELSTYRTLINVLVGNPYDLKESIADSDGLYTFLKENIKENNLGKFVWCEKSNHWCIWLPKAPKTIDEMACLVHEIEHCVFYLFQYLGMKHSDDSEEAYAYAQDYLFREIMTKVK